MRILVEPSDYVLRNAGDAAMLHVAVTRLSELWPDASIQVFSDAPENLPQYSPHSRPLSGAGRRSWLSENVLQHTMLSRVVSLDVSRASRFERTLRRRFPEMLTFIRQRHGLLTEDVDEFLTAVTEADLLIVAGMGGITDAFPEYAHGVLETLSLAQQNGVATVMVGQGLGPIRVPTSGRGPEKCSDVSTSLHFARATRASRCFAGCRWPQIASSSRATTPSK